MAEQRKGFSRRDVRASDFTENLQELTSGKGRTDRYSTGIPGLDDYLFGGYGRKGKWEIIVIHASYGVGKSTLGLQMLSDPIKKGVRVGIMALEDDPEDVVMKLNLMLGGTGENPSRHLREVRLIPQESLERFWTFDELLSEIERWFTDMACEIVMLDHLQFAFDSAALGEEKDQWRAQSNFMFRLNVLMKKLGDKTIILISQQNKLKEIAGSIATPRAATKMIKMEEIKDRPDFRLVWLDKTRGTGKRSVPYIVEMKNDGIEAARDQVGTVRKI